MKKSLILIHFLLLAIFAHAQTTISGMVSDGSGKPLGFANIYIEGSFDGTSSTENGDFSFDTELLGKKFIVADFLGFEQFRKEVDIVGKSINVNIILSEKFNELKAVTVTAGSFEASDKKKAAVLKPLDIVTTAGAMGDIGNALQTLPGTTTVGESGRLFVRGGSSEETQTYIDGMHVPVPYTSGAPNYSVRGRFNPFLFKGTVFNTGGYSAEYGQALSSVLLLNTQDFDVKDRFDISLMTIGGGLSGTKVWDRTAITASVDYTNLGPYFNLAKQRYDVDEAWNSVEGSVSLRQKTGKSGMIRLYATSSTGQSGVKVFDFMSANNKASYFIKNTNHYVNASWKTPVGKKWIVKTGASFTKDNNDIKYENVDLSGSTQGLHLKANAKYLLSKKVSIKFGGEQFFINTESKKQDNLLKINNLSGFAEANIFLSKKFVVKLGGRMEYDDYLKQYQFSPRISSALKTGDKSQVSFAFGQFYQNPHESYLAVSSDLKFRQANHFILNYQVNKNNRFLRAEVYYKQYKKLLQYDHPYDAATFRQDGDGYASGLDVFFRDTKSIKNSKFWISYSYLLSERFYHDFPQNATPNFAAKHHASIVYKYWMSKWNSFFSATAMYSSPRPFNDPNKSSFNSEETKPYKSLNLSWSFLPKPNIVIYAAVTNVFGFKNSFGYQYAPTPDNTGHFASHELLPAADRFFFVGCFLTFSRSGLNQVDKLD